MKDREGYSALCVAGHLTENLHTLDAEIADVIGPGVIGFCIPPLQNIVAGQRPGILVRATCTEIPDDNEALAGHVVDALLTQAANLSLAAYNLLEAMPCLEGDA